MDIIAQYGLPLSQVMSRGGDPDALSDLDLKVHIGVHKTASTHLQEGLAAARSDLMAKGTLYLGPEDIRSGRTGVQDLVAGGAVPAARKKFQRRLQNASHVVISDENLIGTMEDNFLTDSDVPGIYRDAGQRLTNLIQGLGVEQVQLFLALRDPAAYYASCYRFHIQRKDFLTWSDYSARRKLRDISWIDLIRVLRSVPGVSKIIVWRAEDYPAVAPQVLEAMLGAEWTGLPLGEGKSNRGLTNKQVTKKYEEAGAEPDYKGPVFRAFGKPGADRSARRYARELKRLGGSPRVILLRPPAAAATVAEPTAAPQTTAQI